MLTVAGVALVGELRKELDPLIGFWTPLKVTHCGKTENADPLWRLFLKISSRGHASVGTYWTCGVPNEGYAAGKMVISGDEILLYKENWATHEQSPYPNGKLLRLSNGNLGFELVEEGHTLWVEFERETNAVTVFNLFAWN